MASCVNAIGQAIKDTRKQAGLRPEELAELLPADLRTVYRYEASKGIRPDTLARLAQVLKSRQLAESYCDQCPVRNVKFKKKKGPDNRRTLSIKNLLFR